MFKWEADQVAILGVCVDEPLSVGRFVGIDYHQAPAARRAMELLGRFTFDFVLVGSRTPDMSVWHFLRHLRTTHPALAWAMVGTGMADQQAQTARMFGAATLFDVTPSTNELLHLVKHLRNQAMANVIDGSFGQTPARLIRRSA